MGTGVGGARERCTGQASARLLPGAPVAASRTVPSRRPAARVTPHHAALRHAVLRRRWPVLAKQYGVDTSGASGQVPTLLLFEKGKETERLPQVFSDGSVGKARFLKASVRVLLA